MENAGTASRARGINSREPVPYNRGLGSHSQIHARVHTCAAINRTYIYYAVSFSRGPPRQAVTTTGDDLTGFDAARIYVFVYIYICTQPRANCACTHRMCVNYAHGYHSRIARMDKWDTTKQIQASGTEVCLRAQAFRNPFTSADLRDEDHTSLPAAWRILNGNVLSYMIDRVPCREIHVIL